MNYFNLIKNKNHIFIIILVILNFFSHFFPFERLSIGPDDYNFFTFENFGLDNFIQNPHRPLQYIWFDIQKFIIGDNGTFGLYYLFIVNSLLLILTYIFYTIIFNNKDLSFLISIINILLLNKIEIYHTSVFIHIILASSFYILSMIFFINYSKK